MQSLSLAGRSDGNAARLSCLLSTLSEMSMHPVGKPTVNHIGDPSWATGEPHRGIHSSRNARISGYAPADAQPKVFAQVVRRRGAQLWLQTGRRDRGGFAVMKRNPQ